MAMQPLGRRAKIIFGGFSCLAGLAFVVMSLIWAEGFLRYYLILVGALLALPGVLNLLSARKPSEVFPEERPKELGSTYEQLSQSVPTSKRSLLTLLGCVAIVTGPLAFGVWKMWRKESAAEHVRPQRAPRPEDMPQLIGQLGDPFLRANALMALAELGPAAKDAVPDVVRILYDNGAVPERPMAARTLGRIGAGHPATVPALCRALTDRDFDVQIMALDAVADLGPAAKETIPVLNKLTDDENPVLADRAKEAIATIEGKGNVRH